MDSLGSPLAELPVPSTALKRDPSFWAPGGVAELRFEFERDGRPLRGGIRFERVRAFRQRAESHCTVWHVDAYDTLVEVNDSTWVQELQDAEPAQTWGKWVLRHYLIYLDSAGAFEVVAESWSWLEEEEIAGP